MGQAIRMMSYDYAGNRQKAVSALHLAKHELKWHRMDDGVMGGRSQTLHDTTTDSAGEDVLLNFSGTINTEGGGFCSIRTEFPPGLLTGSHQDLVKRAIKLKYRGDGKTYKVLLSDGSSSGPMGRSPSWQVDLPTANEGEWEEAVLPLEKFLPSFGGRGLNPNERYELNPSHMKQLGLMLSLKLSDGRANPPETFGTGVFPFRLNVQSIAFVETEPLAEQCD